MPRRVPHAFKSWKDAEYVTAMIGKDHCFSHPEDRDLFDVWCEISHYGFEYGAGTKGMEWWHPPEAVDDNHKIRRSMKDPNRSNKNIVHAETASYAVTDFPEHTYGTGLVTGQAVRFLEENAGEKFALWVSYPDPHTPYEAPRRLYEAVRDKVRLWPSRADEFDDAPERLKVLHEMMGLSSTSVEDVKSLLACYHAMVAFIDEGISQILDALDRLKLRDDTVVVFCSDHGDFAGEHMMMAKGGAFYDCLTRVPLIVSYPPVTPSHQDIYNPTSMIDVVPTLLRLQGLTPPGRMEGQGLPCLTDDPPRRRVFSEYGNGGPQFGLADLAKQNVRRGRSAVAESLLQREWEGERLMILEGEWKFVHDPTSDLDELYNLERDPGELFNIATDAQYAAICERLRAELRGWNPGAFAGEVAAANAATNIVRQPVPRRDKIPITDRG